MIDFQKGDQVWDPNFGWGKVVDVNNDKTWPVIVKFQDWEATETANRQAYALDGRFLRGGKRTLFFDEVDPHMEALEPPPRRKTMYAIGAIHNEEGTFQAMKRDRVPLLYESRGMAEKEKEILREGSLFFHDFQVQAMENLPAGTPEIKLKDSSGLLTN